MVKIRPLRIADVKSIEPQVFADERGTFFEAWHVRELSAAGFQENFVQDNCAQ